MSQILEFGYGSSVGNDSVFGAPRSWVRTKNGTGIEATYRRGRPKEPDFFFSVLWQIKREKAGQGNKPEWAQTVRLQVESPRNDENPSLNDLKRKVIKALLASKLPRLVREKAYGYDDSRVRTSDAQIQGLITVTLFKVLLDDSQVKSTPEETISAVHDAVGWSVDAVLEQLDADLKQCFKAG